MLLKSLSNQNRRRSFRACRAGDDGKICNYEIVPSEQAAWHPRSVMAFQDLINIDQQFEPILIILIPSPRGLRQLLVTESVALPPPH